MTSPLVSVIIPVYNAGNYLSACVESVIAQTWQHIEIIIVDDGSTDDSLSIANKYHATNVKIISQNNNGASSARNAGLKQASGDYIQFLDADDLLSPDKIEAQITQLTDFADCLALCDTVHFFKTDNIKNYIIPNEWFHTSEIIEPVDFLLKLIGGDTVGKNYGGMIQPNAWLTPKTLIDKAGLWNEQLTVDDDGEFFCRVLLQSQGIKYVKQGLNYYRKFNHEVSLSAGKNAASFTSRMLALDLKMAHLKPFITQPLLNAIFSGYYWEIGVMAFPNHFRFSKNAIAKARSLGFSGAEYKSGKLATKLSKLLGWRTIRLFSVLKHRF